MERTAPVEGAPPERVPACGVLFRTVADRTAAERESEPAFFRDLNLDQVVDAILAGREEYGLTPFFRAPLHDVDDVAYRREVFRDLEHEDIAEGIRTFAEAMRSMRGHLERVAELRYPLQKQAWFRDAVEIYVDAVRALCAHLRAVGIRSRGLIALREYLTAYVASGAFVTLASETAERKEALAQIQYGLHIEGDHVTVGFYEGEADYATEVLEAFDKFKRGAAKDYRRRYRNDPEMDHVEAGVLDRVALRFPEVFAALEGYRREHADYLDLTVAAFDRDVQFYLAHLEFVARFRPLGLRFSHPVVSDGSKEVCARDTFDVALATKLLDAKKAPVVNNIELMGRERILVVTGPNSGGKTTLARTVGQLHYLASLGCLVPGTDVRLFLPDRIFTHFERAEQLGDLRGKLKDDLVRIHDVLEKATPSSVLIFNEAFMSTTFRDALFLSTKVMEHVVALDLLCVWVTFIDELASFGETTVSMVSQVSPDDPAVRTFKVLRRPADGRAYADAVAAKHGLSYERLTERLRR